MWFCGTIVYAMYSQWYGVQNWAFYQVIVGFFPLALMVSLYEMSDSNLSRARNYFPPRSVLIKIVNLCQGCQAYQVCSFILVTSCNMDLRCDEPYRETQKKKKMYSLKEDPCAFGGSVIFVSVQIFSDIHYQKCSSQWNHTAEAPISLKSLCMGTLTVW